MSNEKAYLDLNGRQLLLVGKTDSCTEYRCIDRACAGTIGNHKSSCGVCNYRHKEEHFYIDHCGSCLYFQDFGPGKCYCNNSANDK